MPQHLIWFRNDLRTHDHEPLVRAASKGATVAGVYCFNPADFQQTSLGFARTGSLRAKFIIESVIVLRQSLQQLGSELMVFIGKPEEVIPALCLKLGVQSVYYHKEAVSEEIHAEQQLEAQLLKHKILFEGYWGNTLYHPEDLPFPVKRLPDLFTDFRKKTEREAAVRTTFSTPQQLLCIPNLPVTGIPSLSDLGLQATQPDERAVLAFKGGEQAALRRLQEYIWDKDLLKTYKDTRNGMLGADYSSKFSPWLALGCISPRKIYEEVQRYELERVKNDSTYWLLFELMWRDYFRFVVMKYGNKVFKPEGIQGIPVQWKKDVDLFEKWRLGKTGYPLVDASMREMLLTGFMSNRGRQNVASFLTKNLGIYWLWGAAWFESQLIDHDVCSNYGNWNYTAGVGNDARGFRYFNIPKQAYDYDNKGNYARYWLPELKNLPGFKAHEPYALKPHEEDRYDFILTRDYWRPLVDLDRSAKENEKIYKMALGK